MLPPVMIAPRLAFGCTLEQLLAFAPTAQGTAEHDSPGSSNNGSILDSSGGSGGGSGSGSSHGSGGSTHSSAAGARAARLVDVYRDDDYVLTWCGGAGRAMLRDGAPKTALLQVGAACALETPQRQLSPRCCEATLKGAAEAEGRLHAHD